MHVLLLVACVAFFRLARQQVGSTQSYVELKFLPFRDGFDNESFLCADDNAASTSVVVQAAVSCSIKCQYDVGCTAFNYWKFTRRCEMFASLPCNYTQIDGCMHYQKARQQIAMQQNIFGAYTFNKNWNEFKAGFRNATTGDFWLGNEAIHNLTQNNDYKLRVEVQAKADGKWYCAEYCTFTVANEAAKYQLHIDGYTGTAGDATYSSPLFGNPAIIANDKLDGMKFTTYDRDYDTYMGNCADYVNNGGGFWYNKCGGVLLNSDNPTGTRRGMDWATLPGAVNAFRNVNAARMFLLPKRT